MMQEIAPESPGGPLVVVLAYDGLCTFEFAIAAEVFGLPRPEMGADWYRFAVAACSEGELRAHGGLRVQADGGLELLATADLIVVPGWAGVDVPVPADLADALRAARARGARIATICSGAFALAATGLLDGRRATTHWRYADALQRAFPLIQVDPNVLYVDADGLLTSAGSAAGIDLLLHIVRSDRGAKAANSVARRLVVPAHRSGGQAQFIDRPVPATPNSRLGALLDTIRADLGSPWPLRAMAREAGMSERTLIRHFAEGTGRAPAAWLADQRVEEAKRLLEESALSVERVAERAGFGSSETLRHHFTRAVGLAPSAYRDRFRRGS